MEIMGKSHNGGTAAPVIRRSMKEAGLPESEFDNRSPHFTVTLRNMPAT